MRDIFSEIEEWAEEDDAFAVATVVRTWGSSPRRPGAALAVTPTMHVTGSVSGGCIEGAVIEEALSVLGDGAPRHLTFGVSDERAWSVGLTCGGKVAVFIEPFVAFTAPEVWAALREAVRANRPAILLARMEGDRPRHLLVYPDDGTTVGEAPSAATRTAAIAAAREAYAGREGRVVEIEGEAFFAHVFPQKDQLLIIGAAHITVSLVRLAAQFGFATTVVDPRGLFADHSRFETPPDHLFDTWPQEAFEHIELTEDTYAVLLTHDPKIDDPATHRLLRSPVPYIGALGSRRTQKKRQQRLAEAGFSEDEIARIHGPVGLDIGARTPDEIALAILAEIIQSKNARGA